MSGITREQLDKAIKKAGGLHDNASRVRFEQILEQEYGFRGKWEDNYDQRPQYTRVFRLTVDGDQTLGALDELGKKNGHKAGLTSADLAMLGNNINDADAFLRAVAKLKGEDNAPTSVAAVHTNNSERPRQVEPPAKVSADNKQATDVGLMVPETALKKDDANLSDGYADAAVIRALLLQKEAGIAASLQKYDEAAIGGVPRTWDSKFKAQARADIMNALGGEESAWIKRFMAYHAKMDQKERLTMSQGYFDYLTEAMGEGKYKGADGKPVMPKALLKEMGVLGNMLAAEETASNPNQTKESNSASEASAQVIAQENKTR